MRSASKMDVERAVWQAKLKRCGWDTYIGTCDECGGQLRQEHYSDGSTRSCWSICEDCGAAWQVTP